MPVSTIFNRGLLVLLLLAGPFEIQAAEPVKIASIYAFSGVAAESNRPAFEGVRYGVTELNQRGGILNRPVELIEFDNRSTPIGAKVAARRAIEADVTAVIGASWSSHSLAIAKVVQPAGIIMITTDSTNPQVTLVGDYIFRVCYTDTFQGRVMARFARAHLNAGKAIVFINIASDYSMGLAQAFSAFFQDAGGTVLGSIHYKHQQDQFKDVVAQARAFQPDVLFIPGHDESARLILAAQEAGIQGIPLGADGWSTEIFFERGGYRITRGYYCTHWSEMVDNQASRDFVDRYRRPDYTLSTEPLGYDAVLLLADAIKRAGTLERAAVRAALAATRSYAGVSGAITFDASGDPLKATIIMAIENGRRQYLESVGPE